MRLRDRAGAYVLHHSSYPPGLIRDVDHHIYLLRDPRDGRVRYVGRTNNLKRRYGCHLYRKDDGSFIHARRDWIGELRSMSLRPLLEVVETLPAPVADALISEREHRWVFHFFQRGAELTNVECIRMPNLYAAARHSHIDFLNEPLDSVVWEDLAVLKRADFRDWMDTNRELWAEKEKDAKARYQQKRQAERLTSERRGRKPPNQSVKRARR